MERLNYTFVPTASFRPRNAIPTQLTVQEADLGYEPHTALTFWASFLHSHRILLPTVGQLIATALLVGLAIYAHRIWRRRELRINISNEREDIRRTLRAELDPEVREDLRRDLKDEVVEDLKERKKDGVIGILREEERDGVVRTLQDDQRHEVREELRSAERPGVIKELGEEAKEAVKGRVEQEFINRGRVDAAAGAFEQGVEHGRQQVLDERQQARRRLARNFVDSNAD